MFRSAAFLLLLLGAVECIEEIDVDRMLQDQDVCVSSSEALDCTLDVEKDVLNYNCGDVTITKQCFIDYDWLAASKTTYSTCCSVGGGKIYSYARSCQIFNSQVGAFIDHRTENIPLCLGSACDETDAISSLQTLLQFHPDLCNLLKVADPTGTTVYSLSAAPGQTGASIAFVLSTTLLYLVWLN